MLFSQYIYTSWNNGSSPDKGFMVYGKSRDITEEEDKEILATMRYKPFKSLPYSPTPLEIQNKFPKNYAVFRLKSGRTCIAQASYVGLDYVKDDDPRWGNYIIHALVADMGENLVPHLLDCGLFKTGLSKEEQDAQAGPHVLEPMEISANLAPNQLDTKVLTDDFWKVAQAIIDAQSASSNVFVNIEQPMVNSWVHTLMQLLPCTVFGTLSYCTYALNKNPALTLNFIHKESPTFRPEEEILNTDNFVFYASNASLQSSIVQKGYIQHLKEICASNGDVLAYKQRIEDICSKYKIDDIDVACEISDFFSLEKEFCSSKENVCKIITLFAQNGERELTQISDAVASALEQFGELYQQDKYSMMNTVYSCVDTQKQIEYKTAIWDCIYQTSDDVASVISAMKQYNNVYSEDANAEFEGHLVDTIFSPKSQALAKEYCAANDVSIKNSALADWYKASIKADVLAHIMAKEYDKAQNGIETKLKKCKDYDDLIAAVFADAMADGFGLDLSFDFYMISLIENHFDLYLQGVQKILSSYPLSEALLVNMEQSTKKAPCLADRNMKDQLMAQFPEYFTAREKWIFFNRSQYGKDDVCAFYKKHVVCALGNPIDDIVDRFNQTLKGYLAALTEEQRLKEACAVFEYMVALDNDKKFDKKTFELLYKSAFGNISLEKLVAYNLKEDDVAEMNYYVAVFDISVLPVTLLYKDYLWFKKYSSPQSVAGLDIQQSTQDYDFYYLNADCSADGKHSFMLLSLDLIVKFLVECVDASIRGSFFERLTGVFAHDKDYEKVFLKHLLSCTHDGPQYLMVFHYCTNDTSAYAAFIKDRVWIPYLKKIGKRDREVLFAYLQENSDDKAAVAEYIKQYKQNNRSFLEKLFSRSRNEKSDDRNREASAVGFEEANKKEG